MKILITGGCGFVGTNLALFLSSKGFKIESLDNLSRKGSKYNLKLLKKGAKLLEGTHDFSTFRASSCSAKSPIKKMYPIKIYKHRNLITLEFYLLTFNMQIFQLYLLC